MHVMYIAVMAPPWWSSSILLASLILLYWTTSSAWSHSSSTNSSAIYRIKRDLPYGSKEQADRILNTIKDSLSVFKDAVDQVDKEKATNIIKCLSRFASLAPGVGALASSVINIVLAFISQDDPVLNEVKKGFAEVNRKLDSLSIQISNLATDVEWFNYASVYSQDEVRILNAWRKFNEFTNERRFNDFTHLAELFINYYEYTQTEASVANLYHYLTVSDTSLSRNLNSLLKRKFKCDIGEIGKYNLYFSSLLWKGMVLNEVYWKLIGFDSSSKEADYAQMFKSVYKAQSAVVDFCLEHYEQYMRDDVEEIARQLSPDNKKQIADQVKNALDKKYSWYSWVVLVYDADQDKKHKLYKMIKFPMETIVVAVSYTLIGETDNKQGLINDAKSCYENKECKPVEQCSIEVQSEVHADKHFSDFAKVTHAAYEEQFVEVPQPLQRVDCLWDSYRSKISVHYSLRIPDYLKGPCYNGKSKTLLDSNEWLCECQEGYYGDMCEKEIDTKLVPDIKTTFPLPTFTSTNGKLKIIESKLDTIISKCQG